MATNKTLKGLTIEIGGDTTKLGKALESVDKKSRDLTAELRDINKLLKLDPGNTELLAQKQKVLASAISNSAEKLETLKKAEKQAQEQFKKGKVSEEQIRALQREIIDTTKEMDRYEKEAKETEKALRGVGDGSSHMGEKLKAAGSVAAKGLAAVAAAAAAAGAALVNASKDAAAYADEILTLSTVTGISTDKLQAYSYAAELVDVSVDTLTKSHAKQIKSMKAVQDGTALAVEAYEKLGVTVMNADGSLRDGETVYWEVIDALGQMENETERDALAMQILGKSAQELNPLIEAGSEKMAELTKEAQEVGAVLSEDSLNAMGAFDDSIQRLSGSAGAAKNALGAVLLPELTTMATEGSALLAEFTNNLNASGGGLEGFIGTVEMMAGEISEKAGDLVGAIIEKATALLPSIVKVGITLVVSLAKAILAELPGLVRSVAAMLVECAPTLIDGALDLFMAIVDAVDLLLPELIKAIPDIVMCIVEKLTEKDTLTTLINGALKLLLCIVDAIPLLIEKLTPLIPKIVTSIISALLDCTPQLLKASITLLGSLKKAVPTACAELLKALPQIWTTMYNYFKQLPAKVVSVGKDIVAGLWKGISDKYTWLKDKIKGWVGNIEKFLKKLFGINSPSKVTAYMGEMIDAGFAKGIEDNTQEPVKAMGKMTDAMLGEAGGVNGLAVERNIRHTFSTPAAATTAQSGMLDKLDKILAAIERGQIITINGDTLVGATVDRMNTALGQRRVLAERGAV